MITTAPSGTGRTILAAIILWAGAVAAAAWTGLFHQVPGPAIALLVALGIAGPSLAYFRLPAVRAWAESVGLRTLTLFHAWRIAAAALFFLYGAQGLLPERFVTHAAWGDLLAGLLALAVVALPFQRGRYLAMHLFGFADFLLAVGTGLYFTLVDEAAMDSIRDLPLALIPMFAVGLSGATHLIAFDLLLRRRGMPVEGRG